jgi:hypothetical protein
MKLALVVALVVAIPAAAAAQADPSAIRDAVYARTKARAIGEGERACVQVACDDPGDVALQCGGGGGNFPREGVFRSSPQIVITDILPLGTELGRSGQFATDGCRICVVNARRKTATFTAVIRCLAATD